MKKLIFLSIATSASLLSYEAHAVQPATKALFCESCTNTTSARQVALANPAPMVCTKPPKLEPMLGFNSVSSSITCTREAQKVILLNPNTNQKWAYVVRPSNDYQSIYLEDSYLSSSETEAYQVAIDTRNAWITAIEITTSELNNGNAANFQSSSKATAYSKSTIKSQTSSCPEESALDVLRNPYKIAIEETRASDTLETSLNGLFATLGLGNGECGTVVNETIQVTVGGVTSSVSTHDGEQIVSLVTRDYDSELNGNDQLVYSLAGLAQCGTNGNWQVQMSLDLGKSKILGFQNVQSPAHAIDLATQGGEIPLNDCLIEDVEALEGTAGVEVDYWIEQGVEYDDDQFGGGGVILPWEICHVDFYQSGKKLYSWTEPC